MLAVYAWMAPRLENRDWFLQILAAGGWEWGRNGSELQKIQSSRRPPQGKGIMCCKCRALRVRLRLVGSSERPSLPGT